MTVVEASAASSGSAASVRSWKQVGAVYTAGLLQGLALVTFPAASGVFTDPHAHGLAHSDQYIYASANWNSALHQAERLFCQQGCIERRHSAL